MANWFKSIGKTISSAAKSVTKAVTNVGSAVLNNPITNTVKNVVGNFGGVGAMIAGGISTAQEIMGGSDPGEVVIETPVSSSSPSAQVAMTVCQAQPTPSINKSSVVDPARNSYTRETARMIAKGFFN